MLTTPIMERMNNILATDYIDSLRDENGNVPALLNCGVNKENRIILLKISAELAKYLYLSHTAVYYTQAIRYQYKDSTIGKDYHERLTNSNICEHAANAKKLFGAIEIYVDDYPNLRLEKVN